MRPEALRPSLPDGLGSARPAGGADPRRAGRRRLPGRRRRPGAAARLRQRGVRAADRLARRRGGRAQLPLPAGPRHRGPRAGGAAPGARRAPLLPRHAAQPPPQRRGVLERADADAGPLRGRGRAVVRGDPRRRLRPRRRARRRARDRAPLPLAGRADPRRHLHRGLEPRSRRCSTSRRRSSTLLGYPRLGLDRGARALEQPHPPRGPGARARRRAARLRGRARPGDRVPDGRRRRHRALAVGARDDRARSRDRAADGQPGGDARHLRRSSRRSRACRRPRRRCAPSATGRRPTSTSPARSCCCSTPTAAWRCSTATAARCSATRRASCSARTGSSASCRPRTAPAPAPASRR